jgi:hypothetical protein
MSDDEEATTYGMVLGFDTDDPEFLRGFEAGRLYGRLEADWASLDQTIHGANAEMAMRIGERYDRSFWAEILDDEWVDVHYGPGTIA